MGIFYAVAGINHFIHTTAYVSIMPPWLPSPLALVYISGICELLLGILLMPHFTRRIAAWGIIALLIAVSPANIQMMLNYLHAHNPYTWLTIVRLPLQLVLIGLAAIYTKKQEA